MNKFSSNRTCWSTFMCLPKPSPLTFSWNTFLLLIFLKIYLYFMLNGMLLEISSLFCSVKCQKSFFQEAFCCKQNILPAFEMALEAAVNQGFITAFSGNQVSEFGSNVKKTHVPCSSVITSCARSVTVGVSDSVTKGSEQDWKWYFLCLVLALPLAASVTLKGQKFKSQLKFDLKCGLKAVTSCLQLWGANLANTRNANM